MICVIVSRCLLGETVRWDGGANTKESALLKRWADQGRLLPVCPEVAGGLPVPRPPAEIVAGDGSSVLAGRAQVRQADGRDVTRFFIRGAQTALSAALEHGARLAVLAEHSPSCGSGSIHDGTFTSTIIPGQGVTAALLGQHGIRVFAQNNLAQAQLYLQSLENHPSEARGSGANRRTTS